MTTFEKIREAIAPFGLPMEPRVYKGNKSRGWFTYNYADSYGAVYADDEPGEIIDSVQVHLFLPDMTPFEAIAKSVRKSLFKAGFTYPSMIALYDDAGYNHIVFECDIEQDDLQE